MFYKCLAIPLKLGLQLTVR